MFHLLFHSFLSPSPTFQINIPFLFAFAFHFFKLALALEKRIYLYNYFAIVGANIQLSLIQWFVSSKLGATKFIFWVTVSPHCIQKSFLWWVSASTVKSLLPHSSIFPIVFIETLIWKIPKEIFVHRQGTLLNLDWSLGLWKVRTRNFGAVHEYVWEPKPL